MALYAFDGTGQDDNDNPNDWAAVAGDTNIYRFFNAYKANSSPAGVTCDYVPGVGTRYGGGCTSGHGVCGLSRLSSRSLVATLSFIASGFATVYFLRHLAGS